MNYKMLVDTAILAGEIMLRGGAETYRVEDTVTRILETTGFKECNVFVVSTSIVVTLANPGVDAITKVSKIGERSTDLGNIYYVNAISRKLCAGEIELEQAYDQLLELRHVKRYHDWLINICMIISATSFTLLLGATPMECFLAAVNGIVIVIVRMLSRKIQMNRFVSNMCISCIIAIFTSMAIQIPGITVDIEPVIAGSIMIMLPGVALTNAIRDTLQGDYVSGTARLVEAFVIAASLAVGIYAGLAFGKAVFGGVL